jgi:acyl-[acyl carrier protein]--UDP-N-acetylglucosamine O-acyltransferase
MPHYSDGTEARIGDLVKGTGYNIKREIVGKVIQVTAGTDSCNLAVAHIDHDSPVMFIDAVKSSTTNVAGHTQIGYGVMVVPRVEYGDTKGFDLVK